MKSLKRQCLLVSAAVVVLTLTGSVVAYVAYDIDDATVPSTAKNLPVATELPDGPLLPAFELILPKASELSENECLCLETARDLYAIFTTTGDGKTLTTQAQTTLARIAQWPGDGETLKFQFQNSPEPRWVRFDDSHGTAITFHLYESKTTKARPSRIEITSPRMLGSNFLTVMINPNGRLSQKMLTTKPRRQNGVLVMPSMWSAQQWNDKGELIDEVYFDPPKKLRLMKDENHEIPTL